MDLIILFFGDGNEFLIAVRKVVNELLTRSKTTSQVAPPYWEELIIFAKEAGEDVWGAGTYTPE